MEFFETIPLNIYIREKNTLQYPLHYHKSIEIIYVHGGSGGSVFVDTKEYKLVPHSLMITFPNQIHYYPKITDTSMTVIMFEPSFVPDFQNYFEKYENRSPVIYDLDKNPRLEEYMRIVVSLYKEYKDKTDIYQMWKVIVKGIMTAFVCEIMPLLTLAPIQDSEATTIKKVLKYCEKNYKNNISLQNVADELYLNYHYVSRIFNNKLRIGFKEYINHLRMMEAKRLLAETKNSVTEIAMECGFNSMSTFNRIFLETTNFTPTAYRKRYRIVKKSEKQ